MQGDLIYDVGMHIGQDTEFFLKKGFRVVAVEANPRLAEQARRRYRRSIAKGRLVVLNCGIASDRGTLPFYVNRDHSEWSSFDEHLGKERGAYDILPIETVPLRDVLVEHGVPYYLKIDIEGHDQIALKDLASVRERPVYVSVESGTVPMLQFLVELGYTSFKFINQAEVPKMTCPQPASEGVFVRHRFPFGASGPFGEETVGTWKNRAEMERIIEDYWETPGLDAAVHGWFDLHSRRDAPPRDPPAERKNPWVRLLRLLGRGRARD